MSRLRVLIGAFACAPPGSPTFYGGEELLGWQIVHQAARFHDVTALVWGGHRDSIRRTGPGPVRYEFVDLPAWMTFLRRFQGGIQLYSYLWQLRAHFVARRLHAETPFDLFHHVTYSNDWMASHIGSLLPVPYVRGPAGGAQKVPGPFRRGRGARFRLAQWQRSILQHVFRLDPFFRRGQRRARLLLFSTNESINAMPARWRGKALRFPMNGMSVEELQDSPRGAHRGPFTVVTSGKLLPIKGFDLALRAFAKLVEAGISTRFLVIGEGPERKRLERLAASLGVASQVVFLGWLPHAEALDRMRSADAFLFPSLRDGGGAVVVEAMACRLPVICLDLAGPGVHVTDETGIKVAPRSPEQAVDDMAAALVRLARSPKMVREMGRAGLRRVRETYLWDRIGERLDEVYGAALNRVRTGAALGASSHRLQHESVLQTDC